MARRLVERGVRYIQIYINEQIWYHHKNLESGMRSCCLRTDKPVAGLLAELNLGRRIRAVAYLAAW